MKLYEYALIHHPKSTKKDAEPSKSVLLNGGVAHVLAINEQQVAMIAARHIPKEFEDKLEQVEIAIRPF